jgi:peptidoglycan/LPS O-acetylase OafA/YrhL
MSLAMRTRAHPLAIFCAGKSSTVKTPGRYRPDIDGLRAISVLSVMAYHVGTNRVPGGYIGVDVFFVISGYLITSMIFGELRSGKFTIAGFYERRIRRILPALAVMLAVSAAVGALVMYPGTYVSFAKTLTAADLSFSNVYFWLTAGYFTQQSDTIPLLHTWSLGAEEQYYLAFPLILAAVYRYWPRFLVGAIVCIAVVSFIGSEGEVFLHLSGAFYLLHSRAWELLLGALIALNAFPNLNDRRARNVEGLVGIALVLGSVLVLSRETPFPGLAALPACVGAGLIIRSGAQGDTFTARLLSLRGVAFVGLISYSLYLWHWPIIVFFKDYLGVSAFSKLQKAEVFVLSFAFAVLSWWFVERPCRRAHVPRATVFAVAGLVCAAIALIAAAIVAYDGFPNRFSSEVARISAYTQYDNTPVFRKGTCFITSDFGYEQFDKATCMHKDAHRPNILVAGDSHAAALWPGFSKVLTRANVMQATASGCKAVSVDQPEGAPRCTALMDYVFGKFLPTQGAEFLVLGGRWDRGDLNGIERTLQWAKAHHITAVLMGPIVEYTAPLPKLVARGLQNDAPAWASAHKLAGRRELDRDMAKLAAANGAKFISLYDTLCPADHCIELTPDRIPVQFDYGHMTREGSELVAEAIRRSGVFGAM